MSKMIQIRNVPEALHRKLKMRAAERGMTLSDFLLEQATIAAETPSLEELVRRIDAEPPLALPPEEAPASVIRRLRDD
ncbi:FitA-like ribbon-helix-helix domain-containing protein [Truepera radiovictrix]|nr:hypothetical protein [Truepera radiovictrix]WMT58452.1 hypothetical protein RCV51_05785 [Truepera radiovictrix]